MIQQAGESLFSARPKTVDMSRGKGAIYSVVWQLLGYVRETHNFKWVITKER